MPNKSTEVASKFVDLVLKYERWDEVKTIPADEIQILFEIVSAAGFPVKKVILGKLVGYYLDQDGSRTGKTYLVNSLCPFKVICEDGDHYFATGWLDCAFRRVVYGKKRQNEGRDKLIEVIIKEIERSLPLEPIRLTPEGDFLCEYPPSPRTSGFEYFVKHTRDEDNLGLCVGIHEFCNSWMERVRATKTHDAIVCRGCHLRVLFPKEVKTYGDLRQALSLNR